MFNHKQTLRLTPHSIKYHHHKWKIPFYEFLNIKASQKLIMDHINVTSINITVAPFTPPIPIALHPVIKKRMLSITKTQNITIKHIRFIQTKTKNEWFLNACKYSLILVTIATTFGYIHYVKTTHSILDQLSHNKKTILMATQHNSIVATKLETYIPILQQSEAIKSLHITPKLTQLNFYIDSKKALSLHHLKNSQFSSSTFKNLIRVTIDETEK